MKRDVLLSIVECAIKENYLPIYKLVQEFGLSRQIFIRGIHSGELTACKYGYVDDGQDVMLSRWYVLRDEKLLSFVEKKKDKI